MTNSQILIHKKSLVTDGNHDPRKSNFGAAHMFSSLSVNAIRKSQERHKETIEALKKRTSVGEDYR